MRLGGVERAGCRGDHAAYTWGSGGGHSQPCRGSHGSQDDWTERPVGQSTSSWASIPSNVRLLETGGASQAVLSSAFFFVKTDGAGRCGPIPSGPLSDGAVVDTNRFGK